MLPCFLSVHRKKVLEHLKWHSISRKIFNEGFHAYMYLVTKLPKCNNVLRRVTDLKLMESILESLNNGGSVGCRMKEDYSQTSGQMHHSKPGDDIGSGAIADPDAIFDPKLIQNC